MKAKKLTKRVADIAMTVTLLLLMAFQVTEQLAHEWLGMAMLALTIFHQVLNRKYYTAIFKGKYSPIRVFQLLVNSLLLLSFMGTALSGMMMSRFATPFMSGLLKASLVRQAHLALSHWSFVLMGIHIGLHFTILTVKIPKGAARIATAAVMSAIAVYGFYLFVHAGFIDYMLLRVSFVFFNYTKAWWLVILENLSMLLAWAFVAYLFSLFLKAVSKRSKKSKSSD